MARVKKAQIGSLLSKFAPSSAKKVAMMTLRKDAEKAAARKAGKSIVPPRSLSTMFEGAKDDFKSAVTQKGKEKVSQYNKAPNIKNKIQKDYKKGGAIMKSGGSTPAWQRKEGKDPSGGLNAKGVASYRRANPGSKLKTAVTTKPSKLKPGSKAANRRKSFCARMSGMKKRLTSAKTANDPNSRINKSLRKWNC